MEINKMVEGNYGQRRGGGSGGSGGGRPQRNFNNNRHRPRSGGRSQRPLLTSAITAAGLSLVALIALNPENPAHFALQSSVAFCVTSFGASSVVSYVAQRAKGKWVEKISDAFFLLGAVTVVWIGIQHLGVL